VFLHNRVNSGELKERLMNESFRRKTISVYRYFYLDNSQEFRDELYRQWFSLNCFGHVYVAREGINGQVSVPEHHVEQLVKSLAKFEIFRDIPLKYTIEDNGKSFYKLTIKLRTKLVADGLMDGAFDVTNVGTHLSVWFVF
jgi:UPF0176 protein